MMRTSHFIFMMGVFGGILFWQMRELWIENPWYAVPFVVFLLFSAVLNHLFRQPGPSAQRRASLFGMGSVALLASAVFGGFCYSFMILVYEARWQSDLVWIFSAVATGALAGWLWYRFAQIFRRGL